MLILLQLSFSEVTELTILSVFVQVIKLSSNKRHRHETGQKLTQLTIKMEKSHLPQTYFGVNLLLLCYSNSLIKMARNLPPVTSRWHHAPVLLHFYVSIEVCLTVGFAHFISFAIKSSHLLATLYCI